MDEAVDSFKAEYSSETDQEVKDCISPDWPNDGLAHQLLQCNLSDVKKFR